MARSPMSADFIAPAGAAVAFEPQRKSNFLIRVSPPGNGAQNAENLLQLAVQNAPFPKGQNEELVVPYGNEERKVAGRAKFDGEAISFKDFVDKRVLDILVGWRRLVYDPRTGKNGYAFQYKTTADFYWVGPDGETYLRMWKVWGMWPSRLDPGDGSMADNGQNLVQVKFAYDYADYIGAR